MHAYSVICFLFLLAALPCLDTPGRASEPGRSPKAVANPHSDGGDCSVCHVAPEGKLRSWFAFESTKKELKSDLNQVCLQCHTILSAHAGGFQGGSVGHATGRKTAINHQNLPLAADGTITCATTCHNVHVTSEDGYQQHKRLRLPVNPLCISCHDK